MTEHRGYENAFSQSQKQIGFRVESKLIDQLYKYLDERKDANLYCFSSLITLSQMVKDIKMGRIEDYVSQKTITELKEFDELTLRPTIVSKDQNVTSVNHF